MDSTIFWAWPLVTTWLPRKRRFCFADLFVAKWRLPAPRRMSLPVALILNRFTAALRVLFGFLRGIVYFLP